MAPFLSLPLSALPFCHLPLRFRITVPCPLRLKVLCLHSEPAQPRYNESLSLYIRPVSPLRHHHAIVQS